MMLGVNETVLKDVILLYIVYSILIISFILFVMVLRVWYYGNACIYYNDCDSICPCCYYTNKIFYKNFKEYDTE